jgi:hypothetical protein
VPVDVDDVDEVPGGDADVGVRVVGPPAVDDVGVARGALAAIGPLERDLAPRGQGEDLEADAGVPERRLMQGR